MDEIRAAMLEIIEAEHPMTVRQVFYRLVSTGLIGKTEAEYKTTIGRLLTEMRRAGELGVELLPEIHQGEFTLLVSTAVGNPLEATEAVMENDQVYRYDRAAGTLELVQVTTGIRNWNFTEVTGGLEEGDEIVLSLDEPGLAAGITVVPRDD